MHKFSPKIYQLKPQNISVFFTNQRNFFFSTCLRICRKYDMSVRVSYLVSVEAETFLENLIDFFFPLLHKISIFWSLAIKHLFKIILKLIYYISVSKANPTSNDTKPLCFKIETIVCRTLTYCPHIYLV